MSQIQPRSPADQYRRDEVAADKRAKDDRVVRGWQIAKRVIWSLLLAAAFLAFYLMDKLNEALSILR